MVVAAAVVEAAAVAGDVAVVAVAVEAGAAAPAADVRASQAVLARTDISTGINPLR